MENRFTLISGRTKAQAHGLHKGPDSEEYLAATCYVEMGEKDMKHLGIAENDSVKIRSDAGQVKVRVRSASLPPGLIFIPMGPTANTLVGTRTFGTGMPNFKGETVEVKRI